MICFVHLLTSILLLHHLVVLVVRASQVCCKIRRVTSRPLHQLIAQLARCRVVARYEVLPDRTLLGLDVLCLGNAGLCRHLDTRVDNTFTQTTSDSATQQSVLEV